MTAYPVPTDNTYDYVPITHDRIVVGSDVLAAVQSTGVVTTVIPGTPYLFDLATVNPDGTAGTGFAFLPEDPPPDGQLWWIRVRMWSREAKPAFRDKVTGPDGSEWIYPATSDGKMICYHPGTVFARGARMSRGAIAAGELEPFGPDDPEWDWLPITDPATVAVDDYVAFAFTVSGVVDHIDVTDYTTFLRSEFHSADNGTLGWFDTVDLGQSTQHVPSGDWQWFSRLPKPASEAEFRGADGSMWIYTDGQYYCWAAGTQYVPGAIFLRGEIAGGLTPLT